MRFVNYRIKNKSDQSRVGFIINENVYDVQESYHAFLEHEGLPNKDLPSDPARFFGEGFKTINKAQDAFEYISEFPQTVQKFLREEVVLGPPNPNPGKIICVGLNYADHVKEMGSELQEYPVLFSKFSNALVGPEDAIEKNALTNMLDYEVELVAMIGKEASKVKREGAYKYIAGYTIGNDISARDLQKRTPQWLQGKTLDRSTPIGPWVVTTDEFKPDNIGVRSYVNGELRQQSNTRHFIFNIPYLIEFISNLITLQPGDLIFTGTPDGVGMGRKPQQFLQAGDMVTLEIDGIGVLENKIIDQQ